MEEGKVSPVIFFILRSPPSHPRSVLSLLPTSRTPPAAWFFSFFLPFVKPFEELFGLAQEGFVENFLFFSFQGVNSSGIR